MKNFLQIYKRALKLMSKYSSSDATHKKDHTERVLSLIDYLVCQDKVPESFDLESLKLAAILHDLGQGQQIKRLQKSNDKFKSGDHAKHSLLIAEEFLKKEGLAKEQIIKIKNIISSHGSDGKNDSLEGNILHDADLLDGIGLVGVLRKFTYGGQIGRGLLGSLEFTKSRIKSRQFRTKTAQQIGHQRIKKVKTWLSEVEDEMQGKDIALNK